MLQCTNGYTYIGTTNNLPKRFQAHQQGKGAKFTRMNRPLAILGAEPFTNRSSACKAEYALKQVSPEKKRAWSDRWPYSNSVS